MNSTLEKNINPITISKNETSVYSDKSGLYIIDGEMDKVFNTYNIEDKDKCMLSVQ